jgi:hypothetical protein
MVAMTNNHNLFRLPYWAPALRRVPTPLQVLNEAYLRGRRTREAAGQVSPRREGAESACQTIRLCPQELLDSRLRRNDMRRPEGP